MFNIYVKILNKMKNKDINFKNLDSFILVSTFFSLWLAVYFEDRIEDIFAYVLILSFGILHGANDLELLQKPKDRASKKKGFSGVFFYYLLFVVTSACLFYVFPALALFSFILFSGYHFGEQHWVAKMGKRSITANIFFTVYGLSILFLLFWTHQMEVSKIIQNITGFWIPTDFYVYPLCFVASIFVIFYIILIKQHKIYSFLLKELFYLLVFFILFNTASLIWAFAIYFILWHSLPSLVDQIKFLYGSISRDNFFKYLKSSSIYWGISVFGLMVLFLFFEDSGETTFLSLFFSFLAAITFPHVWVISRLNGR